MSRFVDSVENNTARIPGARDPDLATTKSLVVDCSRDIPAVSNTHHVQHLRLNNFTAWNDRLRELVAGLKNVAYCEVRGTATSISEEWKFLLGCARLRYLRMELEKVETLPRWFSDLHQLVGLDLSRNRLSYIPKPLLSLVNLRELDLSDNAIALIADDFGRLHSLEDLDLSHNSLRLIAEASKSPPRLRTLGLRHNKLEAFPAHFLSGEALERLHIEYNYFGQIPSAWIARTGVKRLSLSSYVETQAILTSRADIDLTVFGPDDAI